MAVDATPDTFSSLVGNGNVLVDFWGPRCQPCLALMPAVEALEESYEGRLKLVKVNAPENRTVCRDLKVMGLPDLPPVPGRRRDRAPDRRSDQGGHRVRRFPTRGRRGVMELELRGKRVIALGERDGVPGQAIADCVRTAGAEVVLAETECFV